MSAVRFQLNVDDGLNSRTYQLPTPEAARSMFHTITQHLSSQGYTIRDDETHGDRATFVDAMDGGHKICVTFTPVPHEMCAAPQSS